MDPEAEDGRRTRRPVSPAGCRKRGSNRGRRPCIERTCHDVVASRGQQADELLERHGAAVADAIVELEARLGVKPHFLRELQSDPSDCVSLAHQLEVVSKRDVRFIDALSEVRNRFAHRLEKIHSNLSTFATSLSPTDFRKLVGGVVALPSDRDWLQNSPRTVRALFAGFLRCTAWMNGLGLSSRKLLMAADERARYAWRILGEARRGVATGLLGELRATTAQRANSPPSSGLCNH